MVMKLGKIRRQMKWKRSVKSRRQWEEVKLEQKEGNGSEQEREFRQEVEKEGVGAGM